MTGQIRQLQAAPEAMEELRHRSRSTIIAGHGRDRAHIILLRLEGQSVEATAKKLATPARRDSQWSRRIAAAGLEDQPGRGRKPSIPAAPWPR